MLKYSEVYSSYINEAYNTLKDELNRSEYLVNNIHIYIHIIFYLKIKKN
jgi:hypothetical protein